MPEHDPSTPGFHSHRNPVLMAKFALDRLRAALARKPWPTRGSFLHLFPKNSVGAELGVFCGEFSQHILDYVKPAHLYLVDPWWREFGEVYPDWGAYTRHGKLPTREAHGMVEAITRPYTGGKVEIHVGYSIPFLETLPDAHLDWVYLDTTHTYEDTLKELEVLRTKVKPTGLIAGHDWHPDPTHWHHGVYRAVNDFMKANPSYEVIHTDARKNWVLKQKAA